MKPLQNFIRKITVIGTVLFSGLLLNGCYDRQKLEQQAFAISVAIDKAPNNLIDCTFRFELPQNPMQAGDDSKQPLAFQGPVTFRAHSLTEALLLANSSVERTITLNHLTSVTFGEDLAREGLNEVLQPMLRLREIRGTVNVIVTKGKARDILLNNKPVLEETGSKIPESIGVVATQTGTFPVSKLHDFIAALELPHEDPVTEVRALNRRIQKDPQGKQGIVKDTVDFRVGQTSRLAGNLTEWGGAAIFRGDKLVGLFDARQTLCLQLLRGEVKSTKIDLTDPLTSKSIGLRIRQEHRPRVNVQLSNPLFITANLPLTAFWRFRCCSFIEKLLLTCPLNPWYIVRARTLEFDDKKRAYSSAG